ncbi:MAG: alanine--tRNA ligase [SAR86 cluster bacterium]|uniref:Alanine--tRNA ligase n=1 Tax=SAR86 cluster bacterium TaxID=2030880 RepID=A0A937JBL1_9GAMM|nr:alanine--tRNA ligase [SAR86 cluster bacterium]
MNTKELRQAFLDFYKSKDHTIVDSSSLVPVNDDTLLFTNAGMVQFKDVFLGTEKRKYVRATTSQRCIRAGGKHNDLENVGYTLRHHTFFEMLGNFSFGDYFKNDAIAFAWEFLTEVLKLPEDKLWISVYKDDDEAAAIWKDEIGINPDRIVRLGEEDNFWSMGDTGPCGPCSEIYYDHGDHIPGTPPGSDGDEGDRFVEIWNLVFMQFNRDSSGEMSPLPKPSVDTGMGLERIAAVMQGVNSNYDTDFFKSLIDASEKLLSNTGNVSHKVIADHIRSTSFLIADNVLPENEGRGYVLRRILRRAIRHGYKMGATKPFLHNLVSTLASLMSDAYPVLREKEELITTTILDEELKFFETLEKGIQILEDAISSIDDKTIPGNVIFKLHDTFGFPFDLTADIARERDLLVDLDGFNDCMAKQKQASKAASSFTSKLPAPSGVNETEFIGYDFLEAQSKIIALWDGLDAVESIDNTNEIFFATDKTPFYAESGGQVGDRGTFSSKASSGAIIDCKKQGKVFIHKAILNEGTLNKSDVIDMSVEKDKRQAVAIHHSATHLMHAALKEVLGEHVQQKGSLVDEHKLRFDFSHGKPLSKEEISKIESIVNREMLSNVEVTTEIMELDKAMESGAQALFGEKYDDEVRVLSMGEKSFSVELCGGTHVDRTGDMGLFIIVNQSSVASGIRRVEALSGKQAMGYLEELRSVNDSIQQLLNTPQDSLEEKIKYLIDENKKLKKGGTNPSSVEVINSQVFENDGWNLILEQVAVDDNKLLRGLVDKKKNTLENGVIVLLNAIDSKVALVCGVTKSMTSKISAGDVIKVLAESLGGKGGGRSDFAQGAGETKDIKKFVTSIPDIVKSVAK